MRTQIMNNNMFEQILALSLKINLRIEKFFNQSKHQTGKLIHCTMHIKFEK